MMRCLNARWFSPAATACGLVLCAGCSGRADVRFVSLDAQEIDPPSTSVIEYRSHEAWWSIADDGELVISIRARKPGLLAPAELLVSLVPGGPPAGSGRNYALRHRETRIAVKSRGAVQRLRAYKGVMTVSVDDERTIHGSFRVFVRADAHLQLLSLFPPRPGDFICFGTFSATRDPQRADLLRREAEALCGTRPPAITPRPAATQPASQRRPANDAVGNIRSSTKSGN